MRHTHENYVVAMRKVLDCVHGELSVFRRVQGRQFSFLEECEHQVQVDFVIFDNQDSRVFVLGWCGIL